MPQAGTAGRQWLDEFDAAEPGDALAMLAGMSLAFECPDGIDLADHEHSCAKAAFLADKLTKNYLVRCWVARENLIGKVRVANGLLVHERAPRRILRNPVLRTFDFEARARWEVQAWRVRDPVKPSCRRGKAKPFYVVLEGRSTGLFYRWEDVHPAETTIY